MHGLSGARLLKRFIGNLRRRPEMTTTDTMLEAPENNGAIAYTADNSASGANQEPPEIGGRNGTTETSASPDPQS